MTPARLSVSTRLLLVLVIGITFQAAILLVSMWELKHALKQQRTAEVKNLLETAYSTVAFYRNQQSNGLMTGMEAKEAARNAVRAMHPGKDNFFFIWTMDGGGIAHGSHPEWDQRDVLRPPDSVADPQVAQMVQRLTAAWDSNRKDALATFRMANPGQAQPVEMLAYARLFEPWGWSVAIGAYVDEDRTGFGAWFLSAFLIDLALIGTAGLLTFLLGWDLAKALQRLSARMARFGKGEFEGEVPGIEREDEVGAMARALLVLRENSREAAELRMDQLTGLPNRKLFMDRLKQAMAAGNRSKKFGGLLLIDMDKFKTLNDTQGHDCGDRLLRGVAARLTKCVRSGDTVARLGGDEFVVVIVDIGVKPEEAAGAAEVVGEKVLSALNEPFDLGTITHSTSASIGLTLFRGEEASADELLKQADLAMYKSKDSGRNACRFFDPQMEEMVRARAALDADLRQAIAEEEFELYYQPQIGPGGRIVGAEALIRWKHSERGFIAPADFIPLSEDTGLILPLGNWVLETACKQLAAWANSENLANIHMAVNVSSRQFQRPEFVDQVLLTIERTGANPKLLDLELTESLMVENVDDVIRKMTALKARGVGFVLDDFGTGYSSLAYLKRMPLDTLKIDRSFVSDVLIDPNDAAIAKTVVALAHVLGLDVIAEGVETVEQRNILAALGCHSYQGFYFSHALPADELEEFVRRSPVRRTPVMTSFLY
jgi:diguanylate cyclase (GGDEF)-like protein